jgi:hypothetical protein
MPAQWGAGPVRATWGKERPRWRGLEKEKRGGCWADLRKMAQEAWMEGNLLFYFQNPFINYKLF